MKTNQDHILIGRIVGAHGIRGEVKLLSFAATPEDIARYGILQDRSGRNFSLKKIRPQKTGFIASLTEVSDRNQAEALKGTELFIPRTRLPEPATGEVYAADLIGAEVILADGTKFGRLIAIPNYGAGDLLEIERPDETETVLVPFAKSFVPQEDFSSRIITLNLPEDYLVNAANDEGEDV